MSETPIRIRHQNRDHENVFIVNWCLGNVCNFSCSYCPDFLHNGDGWIDYNSVEEFCQKIIDQTHSAKKLYFEFTGGEVSMWKDFIKICKFLKSQEREVYIGMISNGSRTLSWWEKSKPYVDKIMLSFHSEGYTTSEHFLEVVDFLRDEKEVHVNVMMHYDHFDTCLSLAHSLKDFTNISVTLQPLLENLDVGNVVVDKYTDDQKKIMDTQREELYPNHERDIIVSDRSNMIFDYFNGSSVIKYPHTIVLDKENHWKGWMCSAGVEQIVVGSEGDVFRGWCLVGGKIGNIKDPDLQLPRSWVTCDADVCHCNFDITCSKNKKISI